MPFGRSPVAVDAQRPDLEEVRALASEGNASAQVAELRGAYHEQRALRLPLTLLMR